MPKTFPGWHSTNPNDPPVYHDNTLCPAGANIKPEHKVYGRDNRRLCEICEKLDKEGK